MKRFLAGALLVILALLFLIAWAISDAGYRAGEAQEKFYEAAKDRAEKIDAEKTAETTTELEKPDITELPETAAAPVTTAAEEVLNPRGDIVLVFGGDLNLDENYSTIRGKESIDTSLLSEMQSADVFMHGNVFAFADGGKPADKAYVFRADTADAALLTELGTDVVSLANNHSFDYGAEGLNSTMNALSAEKIACVGAGLDEDSAKKPHYVDVGGKRIAFTAAMRSEKYPKTPAADGDDAGVVKMYDLGEYLDIIREADKNADVVVAYAHWGVENTIWLEQEQLDGARAMIDAGADIVVGAHSHLLQTADVYNGKPIFYGLGDLHGEGGLAKITVAEDGTISATVIPFANENGVITPLSGNALVTKIEELNFVSSFATVSMDGSVTE